MQLTPTQIIILSLVASGLTQLFKLVADRLGWKPGREIQNVILFVVALVPAYIWMRPELPVGGDPVELATALLTAALEVVGFAGLIYNFLLARVVFPAIKLAPRTMILLLVVGSLLTLGFAGTLLWWDTCVQKPVVFPASGGGTYTVCTTPLWVHYCPVDPDIRLYSAGGWYAECRLP